MSDPKKSSFIGGIIDSLVERGRDSIRQAEAQERERTGMTVEQQQELQARTARNQRLKGGPGM